MNKRRPQGPEQSGPPQLPERMVISFHQPLPLRASIETVTGTIAEVTVRCQTAALEIYGSCTRYHTETTTIQVFRCQKQRVVLVQTVVRLVPAPQPQPAPWYPRN